jgi:large subunit ribosomal protein L17
MHRHGYKGRKFGRERDQRRALLKGLADSLIKYESIETTLPKAKEIVPYTERLITKAKKGDLHNRRQIIARLHTIESAHKLVDDIAPKLAARTSGHLRIERTRIRRGDNAQLARVSFVDDLKAEAPKSKPTAAKKSAPAKATAKKPAATASKEKK